MRRRLALMAAATTSMVVLAFLIPLAMLVRDMASQRAVTKASFEGQSLVSALVAVDDPAVRERVVDIMRRRTADRVSVILPDGGTIGAPASLDAAAVQAMNGKAFTQDTSAGREVLIPVVTGRGEALVVRVLVPRSALRRGVVRAWLVLGLVGLSLVVIAVLVADRLARSIVRPITGLAATARRLETGDLAARAEPGGPAEVQEVGHALNRLAQRILDLVAAERESLADLSHRLRTPLTALRLEAESLRDGEEARNVGNAVDSLAGAVDDLIREARRPSAVDLEPETADLAGVVRERSLFWSALAEEQHRDVVVDVDTTEIPVVVGQAALCDAVDALLGNVFAHTAEGTAFEVRAHRTPDGVVRVVVDDHGSGFGQVDVLQRGVSGGGSTGLGLDIARRVVESAGGHLRLGTSPAGGARVEVELPEATVRKADEGGRPPRWRRDGSARPRAESPS